MRRVILDARGDGDGHDGRLQPFIDAWRAARRDPRPAGHLHYILVLGEPVAARLGAELEALVEHEREHEHEHGRDDLYRELAASWPPLTRNIHRLSFDQQSVELLLVPGTLRGSLGELIAQVDQFDLSRSAFDSLQDDPSSPKAMVRGLKALARLAAPGAVLSIKPSTGIPTDCWTAAGFEPPRTASEGDAPTWSGRYLPRFEPKRPAARAAAWAATDQMHALVIGAGLAGCSAAWALAAQGWTCTVLDRRRAVAAETSGNRAGLFHGVVNASDGHHARFNRAAALAIAPVVRHAIGRGNVAGAIGGALRVETGMGSVDEMNATLAALELPRSYATPLTPHEVRAASGVALDEPAWWYPQGGWIDPAGLCRFYLAEAGAAARWQGDTQVQRLVLEAGPGSPWLALDGNGRTVARSAVVILANANDAMRLLEASTSEPVADTWLATRTSAIRGQISDLASNTPGLHAPLVPMAGHGYALPPIDGTVMVGATAGDGDTDGELRASDHALNINRFNRLTGSDVDASMAPLRGRVGWRCTASDRLPLIGALPVDPSSRRAGVQRRDQPRLVPREPGLFMFAGLASRGITTSALGARMLVSWITGAPFPIEASLVDACDPARFLARRARHVGGSPSDDD